MHTPNPNDDLQRHVHNTMDPYNTPTTSGSGRGGIIALLLIVALIGGLIAVSTIGEQPAQTPAAETEAPAPENITSGTAPPE